MGRNIVCVRQHAKDIPGRWVRTSRTVPPMRQSGKQLDDMAKNHSGDAFFGCADPLESVIYSALPGIRKMQGGDITRVDL